MQVEDKRGNTFRKKNRFGSSRRLPPRGRPVPQVFCKLSARHVPPGCRTLPNGSLVLGRVGRFFRKKNNRPKICAVSTDAVSESVSDVIPDVPQSAYPSVHPDDDQIGENSVVTQVWFGPTTLEIKRYWNRRHEPKIKAEPL